MLQQFYKDTLQSNFIKYLLANTYIPTVPFTANIMHVTKGNTYIHDGYFVTAKKSDAVAAIIEDLNKAKEKGSIDYLNKYDEIFIKHEPYVFGRQYLGTTTNYVSSVKGYDSTTHYYLGDFLRAYRAYYNIDLMPYYNCFSNEYIDYLSLTKKDGVVKLVEENNSKYKILSVPIKFCQKYTIALQCNSEVDILPVFIGKKGLLKEKTAELHQLAHHGKYYPRMQFNSPIVYESPHINSVQDLIQSSLQTYDKYLRLLIQVPANLTSSIVVIEGDFKNSKNYSERLINTSKDDVLELWAESYFTKIPYTRDIDVPANSTLICNDIELQKFYRDYENSPIKILNEAEESNLFDVEIIRKDEDALKYIIDSPVIKIKSDYSIKDYTGPVFPSDQDKDLNLYLRGFYLIKGYEVEEDESGNIITTIGIDYQDNIKIEVPFISNEEKFTGVKYIYNKENQTYNLYYIPEGIQEEKDYYLIINNSKLLSDSYVIIEINEKQLIDESNLSIFSELFENYEISLLTAGEITSEKQQALTFNLDWIRVPYRTFGSNYAATETNASGVTNYYQYKDVEEGFYVSNTEKGTVDDDSNKTVNLISDKSVLQIPLGGSEGNWSTSYDWETLNPNGGEKKNYKVLISTEDENNKSIRSIIAVKDDDGNIEFYNYELSFYCLSENINNTNGWLNISLNSIISFKENPTLKIVNNKLILDFNNASSLKYNIISNPNYKNDSTYGYDLWELDSKIYKNTNQYVRYLNQNLYSNLNLLYINNSNTYAFTSRLIEYLSQMVICSNDPISKNIRRVQESLGVATDGLWKDSLRTEIFDRVLDKSVQLNKNIPRDINGFLDKDSEFLLGIQNNLKQDEVWK